MESKIDPKVAARFLLKKGIHIIPTTKDKNPAVKSWKEFRDELIDPEPHEWFGIGMLTGHANGNLEVIDVDCKYDITGTLWDRLSSALSEAIPGILKTVVIAKTRNNGYHIIYRSPKIEGNQDLAVRGATAAELSDNPNEKQKAVIETRGEGGYVMVAPSDGYSLVTGRYTQIPEIKVEDRNAIIAVCRSFSEVAKKKEPLSNLTKANKEVDPNSPYHNYNLGGNVKELLESNGWRFVRREGHLDYYLRPGRTSSKTSGNWSHEHKKFICFSSAAGLPTEKGLDLAELYSHLECDGNKKKAYHQLIKEGFGKYPEKPKTTEFWRITDKGAIVLDPLAFGEFLDEQGYCKYYIDDNSEKPMFIHITNNVVKTTSPDRVKDFVFGWLRKNGELDVLSSFMGQTRIFKEDFLGLLKGRKLDTLRGSSKEDYICFRNGVLKITKDKVKLVSYKEIDKHIWHNHITQRDYIPYSDFSNDYQKFIENVSLNESAPLHSAIGYLLATYKDKSNNKAIILNDAEISDDPNGGSGKGLVMQGIGQLRRVVILDGKTWNNHKSFAYQAVNEDTQILFFDDVKRDFDFESKFSIVTEGLTVEKKNKQSFFIPVEKSPKLVITTNYVVSGSGNSHERRKLEFELAKIYGEDRTPFGDFGRQLFDDWVEEDWAKFDNFMVYCLQLYILNGIIPQLGTNIKLKRLINDTGKEFAEWSDANLLPNVRIFYRESLEKFLKDYPELNTKVKGGMELLPALRWTKWLKTFIAFKQAKTTTGKHGGKGRWVTFYAAKNSGSVGGEKSLQPTQKSFTDPKIDQEKDKSAPEMDFNVDLPF